MIGVIASGTGIEIKDSDSVVGSAGTVNFGDGLAVSPVSAGVVTVTASGGSLQSRTIVSASTTSIADDAVGFTTAAGFKAYTLMKVGVSTALGLEYILIVHLEASMTVLDLLEKIHHQEVA